ncbi:MAG: hypothetical protein AB7L66_06065 [Gemmatimonadales bacterium]
MSATGGAPGGADIRTLAGEIKGTMELVDQLVKEVRVGAEAHQLQGRLVELAEILTRRPDLTALPGLVVSAYSEVADALGGIQKSREAIQHYSFERLRRSHAKLSEVANATESATMELMNGIDRSLALIDQIGTLVPDGPDAQAPVDALRNEVSELFGHLQFQDITAQQLAGVGSLLEDIESRVQAALNLFDGKPKGPQAASADLAYNADASFDGVEGRQAAIDAAFANKPAKSA